CAIWHSSGDVF
nr:immunoglobulin light chain junction region [Macaca mulatta]